MTAQARARVAAATVRFLRRRAQGVLVPGHLLVTAAHVVQWDLTGGMAEGLGIDPRYVEAVQAGRRQLQVIHRAVEPVADIAVLGAPDAQASPAFAAAADAFEAFCAATAPVPLHTTDLPFREPFRVHILTHTGRWVTGEARAFVAHGPTLGVHASESIEGGTSGSPAVTDEGRLVGVVSTAGGPVGQPSVDVTVARLPLAVPQWVVHRMLDPEGETRAIREALKRAAAMIPGKASKRTRQAGERLDN